MHRSLLAAVLAALLVWGLSTAAAPPSEALGQAQTLLDRNDARGAVAVLEDALADASASDRPAVVDLLRRAYDSAARQAEQDGKTAEAETYRDNFDILNRKSKGKPTPAPADPAVGKASATIASPPVSPVLPARVEPLPRLQPAEEPSSPEPAPTPAPPPKTATRERIAAADEAFEAKRYHEAGTIYAELERTKRLPAVRRDHLAYCMLVDLLPKINARPNDPREWEQIDATVQKIRALSPNKWFGEYIRNLVAERSNGRKSSRSNKVVVRGSAPDEPAPGLLADTGNSSPLLAVGPAPKPKPQPQRPKADAQVPDAVDRWQIHESANFRVLHADPALAEKVAQIAEATRELQTKRWKGAPPVDAWTPRCEIYLYPSARLFSKMTGQPEESPGFSTMGMTGGKIIARRVNLRSDHPNLTEAILPHEVTHVVLADLFPEQQIPRWADEGMAVLSEPAAEQRLRATDLEAPLNTGRLFRVADLMGMDYPAGPHWGLYYAQSVSLTRFLVDQGTPTRFVEFVQGAQRHGAEAELRRVYKIDGFADLQKRWLDYARAHSSETLATADESKSTRRD